MDGGKRDGRARGPLDTTRVDVGEIQWQEMAM